MIDKQGSTGTKKTSELEQTSRHENISHQTSSKKGQDSNIKTKRSHSSSPRKRRQHIDADIRTHERKRNYDLEASVQTLALEQKESSSETAKLQEDWAKNTKSSRSGQSISSPQKGLVQQKGGEKKQTICQTKDITEIKGSSSSEISSTSKQPTTTETVFQNVLKWPNLFDQDVDGDT